ncbi:MAG TPA: PAS domain-containing protein, partial [Flavisolibacter sp.]|nr:PAS domain-containing protein [Flavisolibacter sp.]
MINNHSLKHQKAGAGLAELKNRPGSNITEIKSKTVTFLLDSQYHIITGSWYWDMESDTAFISDVIISLPTDFEGTKAIFHPDDVEEVKARMKGEEVAFLDFRIITTYGEVKTVTGEHLSIEPVEPIDQLTDDILQSVLKELEFKEEYSKIKLKNEIYGKCESFSQTGIWYHNTSTYKTWYSPYVYKLHELAPFSINAHLHSFHQFIHPDDKDIVIEYLDKAFTEKHPIHLDYKIQTLKGDKHVAYKSHWFYSQKGEWIVCGTMQDISQQQEFETAAEELKDLSYFQRQQLLFDEQNANLGHWQVNLLTRNAVYSDNYFRIFGLKPGAVPSTINAFINFIHPDDHEQVTGAQKRMLYEHAVPELEFRILRNDGKIRYISQKGKVIMLQGEMTVSGIIQDITVQRLLEKKVAEQNEELTEKKMEQLQAYEKGSIASWSMNVETGTISWSENFALFLGYKTNTLNMSQKTLFSFIHPQDHKIFKEHWSQVLRQKEDISFPFRVLQRGTVRYMEAHFTIKKVKETEFFIGIVKDNTTEYHLQDQLSQRVELAERLTDNIL